MNPNGATREILWNITHVWVMYALFLLSLAIAAYGLYRRVSRWRAGQPVDRFDRPKERILLLLKHAVAQGRTARDAHAGWFHSLIYTGFIILTAATTVVFLQYDLGLQLMRGNFYLYFQSFIVDVFGALFLLGTAWAAFRRVVLKPGQLVYTDEALWLLVIMFGIGTSGFLIEGLRIAATNDPFGAWSPFGYAIARLSGSTTSDSLRLASCPLVGHAIPCSGLIAWAVYRLSHVVLAPFNMSYTSSLSPIRASLKALTEKADKLGVNSLRFTWKDRGFDSY
jgi:hypothetical protein